MKKVGELLKIAREKKNFTLEDVSQLTKIRVSYLQAIEASDYNHLPAPVFVKGFIRNYANALGLDVNEVLAFFRREYDENKKKATLKPPQPLQKNVQVLTPNAVIIAISAVLVLIFFVYLYIQYQSFSKLPELVVDKPTDRLQQSLSYTEVSGHTDADSVVKINGQTIKTTGSGVFSITVDLAEGENKIEISATNPIGKESVEKRTIYYVPSQISNNSTNTNQTTPPAKPAANLEVEISVGPNAAWLKVTTDNKDEFEGILNPGTRRLFTASEVVKVRTGNAGSTSVKVNGQDQGLMGQDGIPVEKEYRK